MSEKAHIRYHVIKLSVFIVLAILLLIFKDILIDHLGPFIGGLMILYGVEEIFYETLDHHKKFYQQSKTYVGLVELIFGIVLIAANLKFEYVCIIWATWSIVRESYEIKEVFNDIKSITPAIISGVESVATIVLSVMLILDPSKHHAMIHLYLLVVELLSSPFVVLLDELIAKSKQSKKEKEEIKE